MKFDSKCGIVLAYHKDHRSAENQKGPESEVFGQKVCIKDKKRKANLLFMYIDISARRWYNNIVIQREQKHGITTIFDFHTYLEINKENQKQNKEEFFMNMKKSLAGVMAGAMAVSAMATVVSADQDAISLTYDLKTYVNNVNDTKAKVTVVANYEGSLISKDSVANGYITFGANNGFVTGDTIYNQNGVALGKGASGSMKEFEFTARPYKDYNKDLEEKYQTYKATNYTDNVDGAYYDKALGGASYNMIIGDTTADDAATTRVVAKKLKDNTKSPVGFFDLAKYDLYALGYSTAENASGSGVPVQTDYGTYGVRDAVAKMTYEVPNTVSLNKADGWGWIDNSVVGWPHLTEAEVEEVFKSFFGSSLYGEVTMSAENCAKGFWDKDGTKKQTITSSTALVNKPTTTAVGAFTAGATKEAVIPFKSTLKPSSSTWSVTEADGTTTHVVTKENDVISALQSRKAGGNYYTKPVAVLNDAIANHDNVVFTFTSYNGYVATTKSHIVNQWVNVDQGYSYETSSYDWHNPTFGQHLYTNLSDAYSLFDSNEYDQYGSYSSAWGINLFTGAVVVNSGLTMQLSDTDTFNWGSNTLSFDWFDITDEGKITDAKTFLTSMLLYTPTDWYWDTLTVVVSDDEDEAIDAGEGLDGEGDTIDDEEPADEEIVEEPEVEETEAPAETEAAPVETAPSPATGNAPVALAVIPVALAAAAVVAKKRG